MGLITSFTFITLNGFFEGVQKGDIGWHKHGSEEGEFASESAQSNNTLLFGRITYGHMASWWPTPQALQSTPALARSMNESDKIVFSNTMTSADWQNTTVMGGDIISKVKTLKQDKNMTILGSGSILTLFSEHRLIDEYQFMLDPVAIGGGSTLFQGLTKQLDLQLVSSRQFKSGVILLNYKPL
ncbi:dihydrofolate reductase family protein [uncultured Chitinophaga sp.]|uniref:dihydrofolate reductase family protein n=1 Tax=uncultured Chitinophaga sp. TaxID=339340 RepID=UPI0025F9D47C|nr:dihydrofolate reductase family protein [uncultured Chitinophaga sp.]